MKNTVYEAYTRRVAFEGTAQECWNWIMSQGHHLGDGCVFYRTWESDGDRYIDVGKVFIFNEKSSC